MRRPHRHLSRREAERLLDDPAAHRSALGTLLAAARTPAQPDELRREDATAAVFHRTALDPSERGPAVPVPTPRRGGRAATRAVVATGAVVALASGGFALAGSADLPEIPGLPGQAADRATESVARTPESSDSTSFTTPEIHPTTTDGPAVGQSGPGSSTTGSDPTSTPRSPTSTPAPTPDLQGLCRAYQATDRSANGSSLDSAAFAALAAAATAAGDADVATYCVGLIGEPRTTGKPSVLPTPSSKPTPTKPTPNKPTPNKPTPTKPTPSKPSSTPTGKPSVLPTPTAKPTPAAPTGSPTAQPTASTPTGKPSSAPGRPTDQPSPTDRGGSRKP